MSRDMADKLDQEKAKESGDDNNVIDDWSLSGAGQKLAGIH